MIMRGLINRSRPLMLQRVLGDVVLRESLKGSPSEVSPVPVALEPAYTPLRSAQAVGGPSGNGQAWTEEPASTRRCRLRIHLSPEQDTRLDIAEAFPRQLHGIRHRLGFEVIGHRKDISLWLTCHTDDQAAVCTAFESTFDRCRLQPVSLLPWGDLPLAGWVTRQASELYAPAAYSKRLTPPDEIPVTPLASVLRAMEEIPPTGLGLYQLLCQPVHPSHNWHRNITALHDYEFLFRLSDGSHPALRSYQQLPGGDEKVLAESLNTKADNDRAIFAVALRLAVLGRHAGDGAIRSLEVFSGLIQHGGRALASRPVGLPAGSGAQQLRDAIDQSLTYRPGFLANARELTSLLHLPPPSLIQRAQRKVPLMETLPPAEELRTGCLVGTCDFAGTELSACIPLPTRRHSTHLIGRAGTGKSSLLLNMVLDDIERGDGVAVIDPHSDLIEEILNRIPESHADRVILLDWTDSHLIPIFNPFAGVRPEYRGRVANDFVAAMETFIKDWGHRLSYLLRSAIHGLLHLPQTSLLDVADALTPKSPEGKLLRDQVLQRVDDPQLVRFWRSALERYTPADLSPAQNKLSMILSTPPVSYTFQQMDSALSLHEVMDKRLILLINLANIGDETQSIIGCLFLSLFKLEAMARGQMPAAERHSFMIHVDEAANFLTHSLEDLLVQTRKFGVGMTLAHQYLRQFAQGQVDALSTVGSTLIFNVGRRDAQYLCQDLQDKVRVEDILTLQQRQAIARIGTEVVRFTTKKTPARLSPGFRERIIERSRRLYYRPVEEVRQAIARRHERWTPSATPSPSVPDTTPKPERGYDSF